MKNLCKKCKIPFCCHYSIIIHDNNGKLYNLILKNHICKYLDKKSNKCLIYKNRLKVNPYCLSIKEAKRQNGLPKECLYIKDDKIYQEKIPKIHDLPNNILDVDRRMLTRIESMTHREFMERFLPLIL